MKSFNLKKFRDILIQTRGASTQQTFADKLGVNRSTLSLLESGKQLPSLEILNKICSFTSALPESFFSEKENDGLLFLMGSLDEKDRTEIHLVLERIQIKNKYAALCKRI